MKITKIIKPPKNPCTKYIKSLWSEVDIEDYCPLFRLANQSGSEEDEIQRSMTLNIQCLKCIRDCA